MNQYILFGTLFLCTGLLFACGKGHSYMPSWKTKTHEEQENIDIKPLCRNVGEVIALNSLIFLLKGLWPGFSNNYFVVAIFAWMIVAGIDVFYIERSQHYNK